MGSDGATEPTAPIDWSGPGGPPSIWEPEPPPERGRSPRWWLLALLLLVLVAEGGLAVLVATRGGGDRAGRSPAGDSLAVLSLTATVITPVEVELSWPAAEAAVEYEIFRDGESLTRIRAPDTTYTDVSVSPETSYEYGVEAVDASGRRSDQVIVTATTPPPPPLSEARLEGTWVVTLTFVEEDYTDRKKGDRFTETWEFVPRCDEGACDVRANLFYEAQERTILDRTGRTYRGEGQAKLDSCQGVLISTTISLKVTVTEADFVGGIWRATRFTGTDETDSPAALSCRAGHGLMKLKGEWG
jgi:hypothetical protein